MKILLTGFEPFGGEEINPAQLAVEAVKEEIQGVRIVKYIVPVSFAEAADVVLEQVEKEEPEAVLCIGQAGGRKTLTPERVAINCAAADIPDNQGKQPVDEPIDEDGPAAYFSTLPIHRMVKAIQAAGVPAAISNSAGTFVCNALMYGLLDHLEKEHPGTLGGFMHVPYLPEQVKDKKDVPSLPLEDIIKGIEAALEAIIAESRTKAD